MPPIPTELSAKAKALSTPLRWRILRLCLHEPRTNRELAQAFDMNPGTMLHHVRSLVDVGFLAADPARPGKRGAKEIPYRATRLTWLGAEAPAVGPVLVETFLQELQGVDPLEIRVARLGVRLTPQAHEELDRRTEALVSWLNEQDDPAGVPMSFMIAQHPDAQQALAADTPPDDHRKPPTP